MKSKIFKIISLLLAISIAISILSACTNDKKSTEVSNDPISSQHSREEKIGVLKNPIPNQQLTMEEKIEDFEYLYNLFKENYPFFEVNKRLNGIDWLSNKKYYLERIKATNSDEVFIKVIEEILDDLNNGHVHLLDKDFFAQSYVSCSLPENNLLPWAEVLKKDAVFKRYDFKESEIDNIKNEIYNIINNPSNTNTLPAFRTDIIIPNEVAYIHIKSMDYLREKEDGKEIRKFYEEIKDYDKLIIDIRGNRGGSDSYWIRNIIEPLIKEPITVEYYGFARGEYGKPFFEAKKMEFKPISDLDEEILNKIPSDVRENFDKYYLFSQTIKPKESIKFEGKIYLIVNKAVYSSSESFAAFCKDSGFATLVGETTGGDGRGINPLFFSLPNSGLAGRFSGVLCLNGDFTINEEVKTIPDIYVDPTGPIPFDNYSQDEAVQYICNLK